MSKIIITALLMLNSFSQAEAKLFASINVLPEEFIACMGHSTDRRCKGHIQMGCVTLCAKPTSTLKRACDMLCQPVKPVAYKPESKEDREDRG